MHHGWPSSQIPGQYGIFRSYHQQQTPQESKHQQNQWRHKRVNRLRLVNDAPIPIRKANPTPTLLRHPTKLSTAAWSGPSSQDEHRPNGYGAAASHPSRHEFPIKCSNNPTSVAARVEDLGWDTLQARAPYQYPIRRLIGRYHEIVC